MNFAKTINSDYVYKSTILDDLFSIFPEIFLGYSFFILLCFFVYFRLYYKDSKDIIFLNYFGFSLGLFSLYIYVGLCMVQFVFSNPAFSYNAFDSTFQITSFSLFAKVIIGIFTFGISSTYFRTSKKENSFSLGYEIIILLLLMLLGMVICLESNSLISFYVSLELQSFCFFILLGLNSVKLAEIKSCIIYFLSVVFSSIIFPSGLSYIYWRFGSLDITNLNLLIFTIPVENFTIIDFIFFIILVLGLLVKVGLFPVHFWVPKVYKDGSILPVFLIATISKIFGFLILLKFFIMFNSNIYISFTIEFCSISAILTGVFGALSQTNFRSLLGYSAIAHAGYIFVVMSAFTPGSYTYSFFYLFTYTLNLFPIFLFIFSVRWSGGSSVKREFESISDFKNVKLNNWVKISILLSFSTFFFSFIGIPPFSGFLAKFFLIKYLLSIFHFFSAIVVGVASVVSAIYYLRIVKNLFFSPRPISVDEGWEIPSYASFLIVIFGFMNTCFIFATSILLNLVSNFI